MTHNVIVETRETGPREFRAEIVAGGPSWARGWYVTADTRAGALHELREDLRSQRPRETFEFIHAPTDLP